MRLSGFLYSYPIREEQTKLCHGAHCSSFSDCPLPPNCRFTEPAWSLAVAIPFQRCFFAWLVHP